MGVDAEIQAQKWAVITAGSWNDRWDVSVGSMTDTIDREEIFYFTPAYYYTPAVMSVYTDNTSITGPADLTGKTVCVGVQTTYQDYVQGTLKLGVGRASVRIPDRRREAADLRHGHGRAGQPGAR